MPRSTRQVGAWIDQEFGLIDESRSRLIALLHRLGLVYQKANSSRTSTTRQIGRRQFSRYVPHGLSDRDVNGVYPPRQSPRAVSRVRPCRCRSSDRDRAKRHASRIVSARIGIGRCLPGFESFEDRARAIRAHPRLQIDRDQLDADWHAERHVGLVLQRHFHEIAEDRRRIMRRLRLIAERTRLVVAHIDADSEIGRIADEPKSLASLVVPVLPARCLPTARIA